ncbi:metalloprotease TIKI1-like protein, partial [Lates japonicus]
MQAPHDARAAMKAGGRRGEREGGGGVTTILTGICSTLPSSPPLLCHTEAPTMGQSREKSVIFALNQTLLQQESLRAGSLQVPYTTEDLIRHYNCGDLNSIIFNHDTSQVPNFNNVTLPPSEQVTAQEIDSYFRQELIYKRNERMGKRVKALLEEHPDKSFFFAFGA